MPFLWRAGQHWYSRAATYAAMSFCLEQLLRLNEVTSDRASAPSGANWVPICVGDVAFFDVNDAAVVHPRSLSDGRRRERTVSYMRCKMPRSKSDASGRNPDLFSVRSSGSTPSTVTLGQPQPDVRRRQSRQRRTAEGNFTEHRGSRKIDLPQCILLRLPRRQ